MDEILYARKERDGAVWAELTLNRPQKGNALTMPMLEELDARATEIAADQEIRVVVLRGNGRFFCTGGDITAWGSLSPSVMAEDWILRGIAVFEKIASLPQPVVAVLSGHAMGGGLELALSADFRIAVAGAKLGTPEVSLGMIAGWSGIRRLAETVGVARAREMTLSGLPITAEQACSWGLVTSVAQSADELEGDVDRLVTRLVANGPIAMRLTKGILATMHADLRQHHATAAALASSTDDCREGVSAFLEKRKPVFCNR